MAEEFNYKDGEGYDLKYTVNDDNTTVTCTGMVNKDDAGAADLIIPDQASDGSTSYNVTAIADKAFSECGGFTGSLSIGNSVTTIGDSAFYMCYYIKRDLIIPNSVITIGNGAFIRTNLFRITIGNSVREIGAWAFKQSRMYGDLNIPNSVTKIGEGAFYECSQLGGNLTIPNSVTEIGEQAFYGCCMNTTLTVADDNANYSGADGVLYNKDKTTLIQCIASKAGEIIIPNSVTTIENAAFANCFRFDSTLTIGSSVTTIGDDAFNGCTNLTGDLTIPNSVITIGENAFRECKALDGNLTIGNSVTSIGDAAFYECSLLTGDLTIPNTVTTLGTWAFTRCYGFEGSLTLSNSLSEIGERTFLQCSGLTGSLTIPDSVTAIGKYAFNECKSFDGDLTIGNSVSTIGDWAFNGCESVDGSLTLGESVSSIGQWAFNGCGGIDTLYSLATTAPTLGREAFYGFDFDYTPLYLPKTNTGYDKEPWTDFISTIKYTITYDANGGDGEMTPQEFTSGTRIQLTANTFTRENYFWKGWATESDATEADYKDEQTRVVLEEDITLYALWSDTLGITCANTDGTILKYAIKPADSSAICTGLQAAGEGVTDLLIPNIVSYDSTDYTVITIAKDAFNGCEAFTGNLVIGDSVRTIEEGAFAHATAFTGTLTLGRKLSTIGDWAFGGYSYEPKMSFSGSLTIPNSVTTIGQNAFLNNTKFDSTLTIGESVSKIDEGAFKGCSGFIGTLTIPESVNEIGVVAFNGCSGFRDTLVIGNSVWKIDNSAFSGCSGFTNLTLGNSVRYINDGAFYGCTNLTDTLTLPARITYIGDGAFDKTDFTCLVSLNPNAPEIDDNAWDGYNYTLTAIVPDGSAVSYKGYRGIINSGAWSKFTYNRCHITFDANGGEGEMTPQEFINGEYQTLKTNTYTNGNRKFMGWALTANGPVHYGLTPNVQPERDLTLYAVWSGGVSSINTTNVPAPFTQAGSTLTFTEPTEVAVYNVSGVMLYSGEVMEYTLPNSGVYIICTANGSVKVMGK